MPLSFSSLPPEIYWIILRLATDLDEELLLNTSYDAIQREDRNEVVPRLRHSIRIKAALSLVSKEFHWRMETILHEVILITRFPSIPGLLKSLRSIPQGSSRPRGHTCRRLDIYLGTWGDAGYLDEAWYEGGHTFWGLLPACPHLQILIARINYRDPNDRYLGPPHLTHNALWKTISSCCAGTLRRLELFGFSIRLDRVELMLRYMSHLEVCDISHCFSFGATDLPQNYVRLIVTESQPQVFDEEESRTRTVKVELPRKNGPCGECNRGPSEWLNVVQSRRERRSRVPSSNWFQQSILDEFLEAESNAAWPSFTGDGPPYLLPKLHTLHLSLLTEKFFNFLLPSLQSLHIDRVKPELLFNTNPTATYLAYGGLTRLGPNSKSVVGRVHDGHLVLRNSFNEQRYKMKVKLYLKPKLPNATLFGHFPEFVTHVHIAHYYLPLGKALHFFPNIVNLRWNNIFDGIPGPETPIVTNTTLRSVTFEARSSDLYWRNNIQRVMDELFNAATNEVLNLKDITIYYPLGFDKDPRSPLKNLVEKGESLRVRVTPTMLRVAEQERKQLPFIHPGFYPM